MQERYLSVYLSNTQGNGCQHTLAMRESKNRFIKSEETSSSRKDVQEERWRDGHAGRAGEVG